jgi:hypothetical protein
MKRRLLLLTIWLLCQIAHAIASLWMLSALLVSPHGRRAWRLAIAYDQLANTAFGGSEDETISSRAGRARREGRRWACLLCRLLDAIDPDHCDRSIGV